MKNATSKTSPGMQHGFEISKRTRLRLILACVGMFGVVIFGYLMDASLAPVRQAATSKAENGFNSIIDMVLIPCFLLSGYLVVYVVNDLYKVYRAMNDPNSYRGRSRRTPLR